MTINVAAIIKAAVVYGLTKRMLAFNNMQVPTGNLGIMRSWMPQIDDKHMTQFKEWLATNKINYANKKMQTSILKLAQNELNKNKVLKLQDKLKGGAVLQPVIISKDNFVIDGSHRYLAVLNNKIPSIQVIQIDMTAMDLIKKINTEFKYVKHRNNSYN